MSTSKKVQKKNKVSKIKTVKFPCLVEVIFEMKWKLEELSSPQQTGQQANLYDPIYFKERSNFEKQIKQLGYVYRKDINPLIPHVVLHRYAQAEAQPFPLIQLGQGIFAANANAETYEWSNFKQTILDALSTFSQVKMVPLELQLRYVNMFEPLYLSNEGNASFSNFLSNESSSSFSLPNFSFSERLNKRTDGRLIIQQEVIDMPSKTQFIIDIGSARKDDSVDTIRLESKVFTSNSGNALSYKGKLDKFLSAWLDNSWNIEPIFLENLLSPNCTAN